MAFFYRGGSSQLKAKKKKKWGWNELREVKGAKPNSWTILLLLYLKKKKKKKFSNMGAFIMFRALS